MKKLTPEQYEEYVNKYPIIEGQVIHINSCLDNDISGIYLLVPEIKNNNCKKSKLFS